MTMSKSETYTFTAPDRPNASLTLWRLDSGRWRFTVKSGPDDLDFDLSLEDEAELVAILDPTPTVRLGNIWGRRVVDADDESAPESDPEPCPQTLAQRLPMETGDRYHNAVLGSTWTVSSFRANGSVGLTGPEEDDFMSVNADDLGSYPWRFIPKGGE